MSVSLHPVVTLTQQLVQRQSVTPLDGGCLDIIAEYLQPFGFQLERLDRGQTTNALWTFGDYTQRPTLAFAGHVDVVPVGNESLWTHPPFSGLLDDDSNMWGRGTVDMKGALAAMVIAAADLSQQINPAQNAVTLLVTSDEEGSAKDGTVAVVEALAARNVEFEWCIVGEPSCAQKFGDTLRPGRRGSMTLRTQIHGQAGHVAYPDRAVNAAHEVGALAHHLATETWDEGYESFPPTSCQVTRIECDSGAENVVPGSAELQVNWRFTPASPVTAIQNRFREIADKLAPQREDVWVINGQPFMAAADGRLVAAALAAINQATGLQAQLDPSGGTSDGRFIAQICPEIIEFGPINATIHKVDEHVAVADLISCCDIYRTIGEQLLNDA